MDHRDTRTRLGTLAVAAALWMASVAAGIAQASTGTTVITAGDGMRIVLLYPSDAPDAVVRRGPFPFRLTEDAAPATGNGRLVVISHGSGGSAWVHADLARSLVDAGFVVASPEHRGDSSRDPSTPGPESWTRRPAEVSRAIDAVAADTRFRDRLDFAHVGLYGMSAGGHTALSLAGGRWSPARFRDHCAAHIVEDFPACVGLATRQTGGAFDGLRRWIAMLVLRIRFSDDRDRDDRDPRIAAIVAAVPFAADFDPASLAHPVVPVGLVIAGQDRWLRPSMHGERVLAACSTCERIVDLPTAGHGALLSPLPAGFTGIEADLLNDPDGFDRVGSTAKVDTGITAFFERYLVTSTTR